MSRGGASPEQLAVLTRILDDHCAAHGVSDPADRERIAALLMSIFLSETSRMEDLADILSAAVKPGRGGSAESE